MFKNSLVMGWFLGIWDCFLAISTNKNSKPSSKFSVIFTESVHILHVGFAFNQSYSHKMNAGNHNNHDNLCILFDATEIRPLKTCRIYVELCDEACRKIRQRRI